MDATVAQVMDMMETIAPTRLAEEWDNVGLQVGAADWPVRSVWVSLDPRPDAIGQAAEAGVDLLITHHPLIFKPLRAIDPATPVGSMIHQALLSKIAVYSAHTNLDSARDGLNDLLARTIGLTDLRPLDPIDADRGDGATEGLGRIGRLDPAMHLGEFAARVDAALGADGTVRFAGRADLRVETAAVASGGGSSLMRRFMASGAQVLATGDLRYHDGLDVQDADRGLVDIGHFASEAIVVEMLVRRLSEMAHAAGLDLSIVPWTGQSEPFRSLSTPSTHKGARI